LHVLTKFTITKGRKDYTTW